jgi:hypothetical protein
MKLSNLLGVLTIFVSSLAFSAPHTLKINNFSLPLAETWETIELLGSGVVLRNNTGYVALKPITDDEKLTLPDGSEEPFNQIVIKFLTNKSVSKAERELFEGMFNYEQIFKSKKHQLYLDKNNTLPDFVNAYLIFEDSNLIEITGNISEEKLLKLID